MIAHQHRFHGYGSLKAVYGRGQTVRGQLVSLKFNLRPSRPYRVAVVVSRKVSKSAVVRNRIRRRVYEITRLQGDKLTGLDLVFSVYGVELASMPQPQLESAITGLLSKVLHPGASSDHRSPPSHAIVKSEGNSH